MRAFLGVLFLTLAMPSGAQAPSPDSIFIGDFGSGVLLFLGEPKDTALRALREHFDVVDSKGGEGFIVSKGSASYFTGPGGTSGNKGVAYGWIWFNNGRVSGVRKSWDINGPDQGVAVVRAIRGAMSSFGDSGHKCKVETVDRQEPGIEKTGVDVTCGKREIQVFINRWTFSTGSGEGVVVNEVLGSEQ